MFQIYDFMCKAKGGVLKNILAKWIRAEAVKLKNYKTTP